MARRRRSKKNSGRQLAIISIVLLITASLLVFVFYYNTDKKRDRRSDKDEDETEEVANNDGGEDSRNRRGSRSRNNEDESSSVEETESGQPAGRCEDPAFREHLADLVTQCLGAVCKTDTNPLVHLPEDTFINLFGQPDDEGVATHFAIFGCNKYSDRQKTRCATGDAYVANPEDLRFCHLK